MALQYSLFFIQRFKGKVLFNQPMSEYTSFRIGGPADVMAFPQDEGDLKDVLVFAESKGFPFHLLGAGRNILVRDGGVRGIIINMSEGFKEITWPDETKAVVGAGVRLVEMLGECRSRGLSGLEFASGIPATMGGAVAMNAGAYGFRMGDVVEAVEVIGKKGKRGFIPAAEIGFSYRRTELPKGVVIVKVHMKFTKKDPAEIRARIEEYTERRRATAALGRPNAGSIFKNPEGEAAGRLIDEAGLKGARSGDAEVSRVHANYIVNLGRARAVDVLSLMALVRDRVYALKGIVLEPEIKVIGED
jgi:UDP-N-acetylmuramate dehydrogenase